MGIFSKLIQELKFTESQFSLPQSYKIYKEKNNINSRIMTAAVISIDFLDKLDPELRANNFMVFRLGSPRGTSSTHFALSKNINGWGDYFLDEEVLYKEIKPEIYKLDSLEINKFFAFTLLPKLTETSLVNLCFATGIMNKALSLDSENHQIIPATCQSIFDFDVIPHKLLDAKWQHQKGQVEIDALFYGERNGIKELYLVESKFGDSHSTLAKHKLVYPYLAIKKNIPNDIKIVPIYLKTNRAGNDINFKITECEFKHGSEAISELVAKKSHHYVIENFLI
jgi:hypothetical protein